jgi:hypothetical protein
VTALLAFDALVLVVLVGWCVFGIRLAARRTSRTNRELAAKLARRRPDSARDWQELRVRTVVPDPDVPNTVLVVVQRPESSSPRSLLLLSTTGSDERARRLLVNWRDSEASVSSMRVGDRGVVLRRRRDLQQLRAVLVHESSVA